MIRKVKIIIDMTSIDVNKIVNVSLERLKNAVELLFEHW